MRYNLSFCAICFLLFSSVHLLPAKGLPPAFLQQQGALLDHMNYEPVLKAADSVLAQGGIDTTGQCQLMGMVALAKIGLSTYELPQGRIALLMEANSLLANADTLWGRNLDSLSEAKLSLLLTQSTFRVAVGNPAYIPDDFLAKVLQSIEALQGKKQDQWVPDKLLRFKLAASQMMIVRAQMNERKLVEAKKFVLSFWDEAIEHFGADHVFIGTLQNNLGYLNLYSGRYIEAKTYFEQALENWQQHFPLNHFRIGDAYDNLGNAFWKLDYFEEAKSSLEKGLAIREKNFAPNHMKIAQSHNNLGALGITTRDFGSAVPHFEKVLEIYEQTPQIQGYQKLAPYQNYATCLGTMGRLEEALPYHRLAIQIIHQFQMGPLLLGKSYESLSQSFRFNLSYDSAMHYANMGLSTVGFTPHLPIDSVSNWDLERLVDLPEALFAKGELFHEIYNKGTSNLECLDSAKFYSTLSWEYLRLLQQQFDDFDTKFNVLERTNLQPCQIAGEAASLYLDSEYHPEYLQGLFQSFEINHASLLEDLFLQHIKQDTSFLQYAYSKELFPFYRLPNYQELQERLFKQRQDAAVVTYVYCLDHTLLTMVMSKDGLFFHEQMVLGLDGKIDSFRNAIMQLDRRNTSKIGRDLYQILIEPIADYLTNHHLYFIPDESLHSLPFEALTTESFSPQLPYKDWPFLIKKWSVSYGSSIQFLTIFEEQTVGDHTKMLAICPSHETADQYGLHQFPRTADLVKRLGNTYGARVLLGKEATEANFRNKWGDANLVHLGLHSDLDKENAQQTYLQFHPESGTEADGKFHLEEMLQYRLELDLMVIQGCNTGEGFNLRGEGQVSMGAALGYIGCPSFITTFWKVEEEITASFFDQFYQHMAKGMDKAKALRMAKLNMMHQAQVLYADTVTSAHPKFWAGMFLTGNTQPLHLAPQKPYVKWLTIMGFLLLSTSIYFMRRKTKLS